VSSLLFLPRVQATNVLILRPSLLSEIGSRLASEHPAHPLVIDVSQKADLFDECAGKFKVPALAA
jgi:coatomer protein complex subunit epsilon